MEQPVQDVSVAVHDVFPLHFLPSRDSHTARPSPIVLETDVGPHALRHVTAIATINARFHFILLPGRLRCEVRVLSSNMTFTNYIGGLFDYLVRDDVLMTGCAGADSVSYALLD